METAPKFRKDTLSRVFIEFHREIFRRFSRASQMKLRDFQRELVHAANQIKKESIKSSKGKGSIRKLIKGLIDRMEEVAIGLANRRCINGTAFIREYFGSTIVYFDEKLTKRYDITVFKNTTEMDVWIFNNNYWTTDMPQEHIIEVAVGALEAEKDYNKVCKMLKTVYKNGEKDFDFDEKLRSLAASKIIEEKTSQLGSNAKNRRDTTTEKKKDHSSKNENSVYIGWIFQREKYPMKLSLKKNQVCGFLMEAHKKEVQTNDVLVIEDPKSANLRVYCRVHEIRAYNKHAVALTKSTNEFVIPLILEPFYETANDYEGPVRVNDLDNYKIRSPHSEELKEILHLPETGVPLGLVVHKGSEGLPFFYPTDPKDLLYQSMIVTGVQGSGKTTFLRLLVRALSTYNGLHPDKRPAVVILDGEDEYKMFIKKNDLKPEARTFLEAHLIEDVNVEVLKVSESRGDVTLSLKGIDPQDIVYLVPQMPTKSAEIIETIIRDLCHEIEWDNLTIDNLKRNVIQEVKDSQLIHRQQKGAIIRALYSSNLRLFDQPGVRPLFASRMLTPSKVTVIDVFDLSDDQKRAVALYLLLIFDKHKMNVQNTDSGLVLMLDEAHRLFPRKTPLLKKEYIDRVAAKINNIVHRGRKRKYGVILSTQSPTDVYPLISNLCNTKVTFRLSGADKWIRDNFDKNHIEEVKKLETGTCVINMTATGLQIPPIKVKIPNVSEMIIH